MDQGSRQIIFSLAKKARMPPIIVKSRAGIVAIILAVCLAALLLSISNTEVKRKTAVIRVAGRRGQGLGVLVSYSYFEKDDNQRQNFKFFIAKGLGIKSRDHAMVLPRDVDVSIVVNGELCTPCVALRPYTSWAGNTVEGVSSAWSGPHLTVLHREENVGLDIAAHNVCIASPCSAFRLLLQHCNDCAQQD